MFLTVAKCWIERLRKGRIAATWWASLAPTSSSVHLFATNNWVYQTSTPNTTMHQISTNHLCNTCCQSLRTTASQHCLQTCFTLPSFHHKMKHNQTILSCSAVALLHVISLPHDPFAKNLPEQNMQGSKQAWVELTWFKCMQFRSISSTFPDDPECIMQKGLSKKFTDAAANLLQWAIYK